VKLNILIIDFNERINTTKKAPDYLNKINTQMNYLSDIKIRK